MMGRIIERDRTGHTQKGTAAWADSEILTNNRGKKHCPILLFTIVPQ